MPLVQLEDSSSSTSASASASASDYQRQQQPPTMSKPSPKMLSLILRAIIMSLLISAFFLFLAIAAIFLVHLFLIGRHLRRQSQNPSCSSPDRMSNEDLHHLPGFRFVGGSQLHSGSECVICLDRIGNGDFFRILPGCSHAFHLDCIDTWLAKAPACPVCRAKVCTGSEIKADGDECKLLWTVRA